MAGWRPPLEYPRLDGSLTTPQTLATWFKTRRLKVGPVTEETEIARRHDATPPDKRFTLTSKDLEFRVLALRCYDANILHEGPTARARNRGIVALGGLQEDEPN